MSKTQSEPADKSAAKGTFMPSMSRRAALFVCLCAALGFIAFGVFRGENLVVLQKAIHMCLECIGIG